MKQFFKISKNIGKKLKRSEVKKTNSKLLLLLLLFFASSGTLSAQTLITGITNETQLRAAINNASDSTVIDLNVDITLSSTYLTIPAGKNITLTSSNGSSLIQTTSGLRVIYIAANAEMTLSGNLIITGGSATTYDPLGGVGGGIWNAGIFNMNGGTISYNTASQGGGGGVYNRNVFNMSGGTISGNTAPGGEGGGVVNEGSVFNMSGTALITGNESAGGGGGVDNRNVFNMSGGTISNNATTNAVANVGASGGGVSNTYSGKFTMSGGVIKGNTAKTFGGGVFNYPIDGFFIMTGGIIGCDDPSCDPIATTSCGGNEASSGGGLYWATGTFIMSGTASIIGNIAKSSGGGVCLNSGTVFIMESGTISYNTASQGGGVNARTSTFNMKGGTISSNSATTSYGQGGGVYVGTGTFTMSGGTIGGTTATMANSAYYGGGVYVSEGTFTMNQTDSPSFIIYNTATVNGGGVYGSSTVTVTEGTISKNTAKNEGGGIYMTDLANLQIGTSGSPISVFSENIAVKGAYWLSSGDTYQSKNYSQLVTLHTQNIFVTDYSAPPAGNAAFTYAYNNYDVNFVGTKTTNPISTGFTVTYNAGTGGAGTNTAITGSPYTVTSGGNHTILSGTGLVPPAGKHFAGWSDGTTTRKPGDAINNITSNITLTAIYANDPVAVNDNATTKPGTVVNIPVLNNDTKITDTNDYYYTANPVVVIPGGGKEKPGDPNPLKAPKHGTVTANPDGTVTYTPNNNTWEGIDEFEYEIWNPDPSDSTNPAKGVRSNKAKVYVLALNDDRITCDNAEIISLTLPAGATYIWYNAATGGTVLENNTDITVMRDDVNHYVDRQWIEVNYKPNGETTSVFPNRFQVRVRFTPQAMEWAPVNGSRDWNDPKNWTNWTSPNGRTSSAFSPALGFVPLECTDVLIPDGSDAYPDLTPSYTGYTEKPTSTCNDIWFKHGGEVVRTDSLHYRQANVELTLEANRWNMISAPLRDVYPGDFYQKYPCPHADSLRIYQQLFAMNNPQTGQKDTEPAGSWTKPFNNPNVAMPAGFGYAIQLIDSGKLLNGAVVSNESWTPLPAGQRHSIWLPKNDTFYYIYAIRSSDGQGNPPFSANCNDTIGKYMTARTFPYRFIYEGDDNFGTSSWKGDVTLNTSGATDKDKQVIVGNPFMSHWDFNDFYAQDSTLITNDYKVLENDNDAAFTTYSSRFSSSSDMLIAPMQSVLVTSKAAFGATALKTRVTAMAQNRGAILKSANDNINPNLLKIVAAKGGKQNQTYVLFDASASNNYLLGEDSYKLFVTDVTAPVVVYTRSADGYALDINLWSDCSQMIPLGIRTSETGTVDLQFEGAENFDSAFLLDNQTGAKVDLKTMPAYSFEKTTSDLFLDGRFSLIISKAPTGNFSPVRGMISIFTSGSQLKVTSCNTAIEEVQVFDMQGRLLHKATNIGSPVYSYDLGGNSGMYIVKASDGQEMAVKKVINK